MKDSERRFHELKEDLVRDTGSHKGENGKIAVIGGSVDYTGAPALAAEAALRTGCDLVKILTSEEIEDVVSGYSENFIVESYDSDYFDRDALDQALELSDWADAVVIGPGLGNPEAKAVREFLQETDAPVVVDADALEYVGRSPVENAVLTPHSGEFGMLEDMLETILEKNNVVVKKGETDVVYSADSQTEIEAGDPAMTVGGTGDVLTGVISSLISQGLGLEEAAELGIWVNGRSGEKAAENYGKGALATDMVDLIPEVLWE